jgi:DNA-binding XRE family transcriptional regulator
MRPQRITDRFTDFTEGSLCRHIFNIVLIYSFKRYNQLYMSDKADKSVLPLPVRRALMRLGSDLGLARRRRRISTQSMAERLQVSTATLRRLERGDPSLAMGTLAKALLVLNALERFSHLLDTGTDDLGLQLMDEALPKRISRKSSSRGPATL